MNDRLPSRSEIVRNTPFCVGVSDVQSAQRVFDLRVASVSINRSRLSFSAWGVPVEGGVGGSFFGSSPTGFVVGGGGVFSGGGASTVAPYGVGESTGSEDDPHAAT